MECLRLTDDLTMDILFAEPALYPRRERCTTPPSGGSGTAMT